MYRINAFLGLAVVVSVLAGPSRAAAAGPQAHACAKVVEANARLACYDKTFPPTAGAQSDFVALEAKRNQAVEEFGLDKQQLLGRDPELVQIEPDRIQAQVKSVFERSSGERVVTLESGQEWLLTEARWRGRLAAGDSVTIRKAALGTYMLVTAKGIPVRARRRR